MQTDAKQAVHYLLERLARPVCFRSELGGNIVIQCQGGSHTLMLGCRHDDVK
jgi:hypothetical protein